MTDKPDVPAEPEKTRTPAISLAVSYLVARLGIFAAILAIFWLVGFRGLPGALAAAIVSIPVSLFALSSMRVRVAETMAERKHGQISLRDQFRDTGKSDTA